MHRMGMAAAISIRCWSFSIISKDLYSRVHTGVRTSTHMDDRIRFDHYTKRGGTHNVCNTLQTFSELEILQETVIHA